MISVVPVGASSYLNTLSKVIISKVVVRANLYTALGSGIDVVERSCCVGADRDAGVVAEGVGVIWAGQDTHSQRRIGIISHCLVAILSAFSCRVICEISIRAVRDTLICRPICKKIGVAGAD